MSTRRGFFQFLAAAPLALLGVKFGQQLFQLPVGCALSFTSLQWAIIEGAKRGFGRPLTLAIAPEDMFAARELLGTQGEKNYRPKYTADSEINALYEYNLVYEIKPTFPYNLWRVEFERGIVESQGP